MFVCASGVDNVPSGAKGRWCEMDRTFGKGCPTTLTRFQFPTPPTCTSCPPRPPLHSSVGQVAVLILSAWLTLMLAADIRAGYRDEFLNSLRFFSAAVIVSNPASTTSHPHFCNDKLQKRAKAGRSGGHGELVRARCRVPRGCRTADD